MRLVLSNSFFLLMMLSMPLLDVSPLMVFLILLPLKHHLLPELHLLLHQEPELQLQQELEPQQEHHPLLDHVFSCASAQVSHVTLLLTKMMIITHYLTLQHNLYSMILTIAVLSMLMMEMMIKQQSLFMLMMTMVFPLDSLPSFPLGSLPSFPLDSLPSFPLDLPHSALDSLLLLLEQLVTQHLSLLP